MPRKTVTALRDRWDGRARANPMYYIHADRTDWSPLDFLASGESDVARLVDPVLPQLPAPAATLTALDIGCGLGRLTRALATRFAQVEGIDIAPAMIAQAQAFDPPPPANVRYQVCDGSGAIPLPAGAFGFVFSYIVFQHVPTQRIIENYLREIARVLQPGGIAQLHINTRTRPARERLRIGLPPSHRVPWLHRKLKIQWQAHSSMGVVIPARACRALVARHGLHLEQLGGADTQYTWLTLRKPA